MDNTMTPMIKDAITYVVDEKGNPVTEEAAKPTPTEEVKD